MGNTSTGQLGEQAKVIGRDVRELGSIAKEATKETVIGARDQVRDFFASDGELAERIRTTPLKSVLIAAGVGAVLSWWLRRR